MALKADSIRETTAPIGVFDSGIGGLTVLKALKSGFPDESFVYLGDTARLPYGTKSAATIRKYLEQNIDFLLTHGVKAIVVACNSASSVLKEDEDFAVPVLDVIQPGARQAVMVSSTKRLGIIGTRATIAAGAYVKAIYRLSRDFEIFQQACPLLVPLVEEGLIDDPITNLIVYRYLSKLAQQNIDTLILGCTHYPVLKTSISKVVGNHIHLVDSATSTAERLGHYLSTGIIPRAPSASSLTSTTNQGKTKILVTDNSPIFRHIAGNLLKPFEVDAFEQVHLT